MTNAAGSAGPVEALLDEVRLLWNAASRAAERLHEGERITVGMRAILEALAARGPATVPQVARGRLVTRQHVQVLVNALRDAGLVAVEQNPAHRRSALVRLTGEGRRTFERVRRRERALLARLPLGPGGGELRRAAATLRAVREALGGAR